MTVEKKLIDLGIVKADDEVWDYNIYGPSAMDDEIEVSVTIWLGATAAEAELPENRKDVTIKLSDL